MTKYVSFLASSRSFSLSLITSLVLLPTLSNATVFTLATGQSTQAPPLGQTTPINYYFSTIDSTPTLGPDGKNYYIENPSGTSCSTKLNPKCISNITTQLLTVSASSSVANTGNGQLYLIASDHQYSFTLDPNKPLSGSPGFLASVPYPAGSVTVSFAGVTFKDICTKALANATIASNIPLNGFCVNTNPLPHVPVQIFMNVILDVGGTAQLTSTDDIGSFVLYDQSSIPVNSSVATQFGFHTWTAFPGDGEMHLKGITADTQYPNETSGFIQNLRVYFTPGPTVFTKSTFNTLDPLTSTSFYDIPFADSVGNLTTYYVRELTNGTAYYFRVALVDMAGNIGYLTTPNTDDVQSHFAIPDQILGLLSKNGQCFVATAAFGSPLADQVKTLRKFRDVFLMKSKIGRGFVSWYYRHSPKWAAKINENGAARATARFFLYPAVGYSWMALNWGGYNASLAMALIFLFPLLYLRWRKMR